MENGFQVSERVERNEYRNRLGFDTEKISKKSGKPKTKTDYLVRLILLQSVLCALTVVGVLIASKISPSAAERLKADYGKIMAKDMSASEIFSDIKDTAEFVFQPVEVIPAQAKAVSSSESGIEFCNVVDDATGETVAVGEIIHNGSGGGDSASEGNSFADYKINADAVMPVQGARLTSEFGYRTNPVSGNYGFHTGIDLAAAENTPVASAYGGTVTETGESDVWGKYVLVRHSDSLETYYCHLNEIYVEEGAVIRSGETVGLLGSTGWSTGPHLHFEVRIDGIRVDPEKLLYADEG